MRFSRRFATAALTLMISGLFFASPFAASISPGGMTATGTMSWSPGAEWFARVAA
jgi:hypothetical protein